MIRKISAIVVPTLIAVAIIAYMLFRVWDDLLTTIKTASPIFLVAAVAICILAWYMRGARYRYILERLDVPVSLNFSTASIFVSQTANLIVPARLGDLVRMFILKHEKDTPYSAGFSSLVVERIFDILLIAVLGALTLPFVINVAPWFFTIIIVPIAGGAVFFLIQLGAGRLRTENRVLVKVLMILDQIKAASLTVKALLVLSISSIAVWLLDILICYLIAVMFEVQISFMVVTLAVVIGNLVKAVPLTPGGVGTYELALALTLELSGVQPAVATLIAVIDHLVKNLVTLGGGVVSLYFFGDWAMSLMKRAFSDDLRKETYGRD